MTRVVQDLRDWGGGDTGILCGLTNKPTEGLVAPGVEMSMNPFKIEMCTCLRQHFSLEPQGWVQVHGRTNSQRPRIGMQQKSGSYCNTS